ncbi:hypothetical protein OG689_23900 [Kitasatospora sp. NBC_00240]|nr:hypothetical protein [Kitasatospora sp. NBC_00240]MCX5212291.1 hypothetical protein [Kitasatospora sp. NBC_00240]
MTDPTGPAAPAHRTTAHSTPAHRTTAHRTPPPAAAPVWSPR